MEYPDHGSDPHQDQSSAYLKRVQIFLEDGDWSSADLYCEKVLDLDPENAEAYLGKFMAQQQLRGVQEIAARCTPMQIDGNRLYERALLYADEELKRRLTEDATAVRERHHEELLRIEALQRARKNVTVSRTKWVSLLVLVVVLVAVVLFLLFRTEKPGGGSASVHSSSGTSTATTTSTSTTTSAAAVKTTKPADPKQEKYEKAQKLFKNGDYEKAEKAFRELGEYKDSKNMVKECKYSRASELVKKSDYKAAAVLYKELGSFKESAARYKDTLYRYGLKMQEEKKYEDAVKAFEELGNHKESKKKLQEAKYAYVLEHLDSMDEKTYDYLTDLIPEGYEDSWEIYQNLYQWKIEVWINNDENDMSMHMREVSHYYNLYVHFKIVSGPPFEDLKIGYTVEWSNGYSDTRYWDRNWSAGEDGFIWWDVKNNPLPSGTMYITIFNQATREELWRGSVRIRTTQVR